MKFNTKFFLLDFYLVREIIPIWGLMTFLSSFLGLLIGIFFHLLEIVINQKIAILDAMYVMALKLPAFLAYTQPIALFLTTFLAYRKLSRCSEILAFQSIGVSLLRLLRPIWILSFLVSILIFLLNSWIVPDFNYKAALFYEQKLGVDRLAGINKNIVYYELKSVNSNQYPIEINYKNLFFLNQSYVPDSKLKLLFYASKFVDNQMQDVTILKMESGKLIQITQAQSAQWNSLKNAWILNQGVYALIDNSTYQKLNYFVTDTFKMSDAPLALIHSRQRDEREMNLSQLQNYLKLVQQTNDANRRFGLELTIYQLWAKAFGCLILANFGAVVAINCLDRSRRIKSMELVGLLILSYYIFEEFTGLLAIAKVIPTWLGVWLPNFLAIGCHACFLKLPYSPRLVNWKLGIENRRLAMGKSLIGIHIPPKP